MAYFDLETILLKYKIDWVNKMVCLLINAERNIGKTTSALNTIFRKWGVNSKKKIGIFRTQDEQIKVFKQDFNETFKNEYQIIGKMLYKMERVEIFNPKTKEMEIFYQKGEHCGYVCSITAFLKMKSIKAENIRYILYDEYNENTNIPNIYKNFISLFKTLERYNKVFFLMMGNRETPNNEFLVKWEVLPPKERISEDIYTVIRDDDIITHAVLEMGYNQFKDLGNENTLSYHFATFDKDTDNYMNGGYAVNIHYRVVPYNKIIKETFNPFWGVNFDNFTIAFGEFKLNGEIKYCLCLNDDAINKLRAENLITYAFDVRAYQDKDTKIIEMESANLILEKLLLEHKKENLYFDSYDVLESMSNRMVINGMFFHNR